MGFFGPSRCDQCGTILRKRIHTWTIDGKDRKLCPACSGRYERKLSREAFGSGKFYADTRKDYGCGGFLLICVCVVALFALFRNESPSSDSVQHTTAASPLPTIPVSSSPPIPTSTPLDIPARNQQRVEWIAHGLPAQLQPSAERAIAKYPPLTIPGSDLSNRFVEQYQMLYRQHAALLNAADWPERLADECAAAR